ncbi:MAG: hypothetical protein ACI9WC_002216 [Arenicella sp.]|jgi:hypothetical protein
MKKLLIMLIVSTGLFSVAQASTTSASYDTVKLISIGSTGNLYIYMTGSEIDPADCENTDPAPSINRYTLEADSPIYKLVYAQVLTAMAAGFELKLAIEDQGCLEGSGIVARSAARPS